MYPDAAFQARVDAAITALEASRGGAVCPIRRVPMDMIAAVVAQDLGVTSALAGTLVPEGILLAATAALVARHLQDPQAKAPNTSSLTCDESTAIGPLM